MYWVEHIFLWSSMARSSSGNKVGGNGVGEGELGVVSALVGSGRGEWLCWWWYCYWEDWGSQSKAMNKCSTKSKA